jgi:hypothetical protein
MSAAKKRAPTSLSQRQREIKSIAADRAELGLELRAGEERRQHLARDFRERATA